MSDRTAIVIRRGTARYSGKVLSFSSDFTVSSTGGIVGIGLSGGGGGTSDHAALSHLAWTSSAHTGTASRLAYFDGSGAAAYLSAGSGLSVSGASLVVDTSIIATVSSLSAYTPTTRTISTSAPLSGGGDLSANRTLSIQKSDATHDGYLSSADWSTFNSKQPAGSYAVTTRTISTSSPLTGGGDLSADRTLGIQTASASQAGALSAADWSVFNGKEPAISAGTTAQYWRGDKSWQTLNKAAVGLGSVENTALSTWTGSTSITTLGTIATGTWQGTAIAAAYGGTGLSSYTAGDLLYATGSSAIGKLGIGAAGYFLVSSGSAPVWAAPGDLALSGGSVQVTQARGLRETSGPTTLAMGAVPDNSYLQRQGSTIVGVFLTLAVSVLATSYENNSELAVTIDLTNTIVAIGKGTEV